jgi:hypothetical protein
MPRRAGGKNQFKLFCRDNNRLIVSRPYADGFAATMTMGNQSLTQGCIFFYTASNVQPFISGTHKHHPLKGGFDEMYSVWKRSGGKRRCLQPDSNLISAPGVKVPHA